MLPFKLNILLVFISLILKKVLATELTFELPDNAKECFHDKLKSGSTFVLEYQVITGGNYDVDLEVISPTGKTLYKEARRQYDQVERKATEDGVYQFCFSNEFSTFSHKTIYIDWKVDGEPEHEIVNPNPRVAEGALTLIETKVGKIHENLEKSIDYQTHNRLREATGRIRAEELQERVDVWSLGQFILIICVSLGTVILLRSFFTDRKTSSLSSYR